MHCPWKTTVTTKLKAYNKLKNNLCCHFMNKWPQLKLVKPQKLSVRRVKSTSYEKNQKLFKGTFYNNGSKQFIRQTKLDFQYRWNKNNIRSCPTQYCLQQIHQDTGCDINKVIKNTLHYSRKCCWKLYFSIFHFHG